MVRAANSADTGLPELFLDMLAAERGAAANTLAAYRGDLDDFAAFVTRAENTIETATSDELRGHLADLAQRGFKASSVARRLSAIRQLYRFLYAEGHRKDDPAAVLEGPKRAQAIPKILSVAEVDSLLAAAQAATSDANASVAERLRAT